MLYDLISVEAALTTLRKKEVGAADSVIFLIGEGYIPNKSKGVILTWTNALIQAYKNNDILTEEQCDKLGIIYTRLMEM